jgi:hypothetical protein
VGATDEADMEARRFKEERGPANITLKELIVRHRGKIGAMKPFGKNKSPVTWKASVVKRRSARSPNDFPRTTSDHCTKPRLCYPDGMTLDEIRALFKAPEF